jgi:hypothetical protein
MKMARATSTATRTGKTRLKPLGLSQLIALKESSKRGRDRQRIQKEIDRRS